MNKKYNLSSPVIPKEQISIGTEEKSTSYGFKIGDHFLITDDGHRKRHWIDSFNKICPHKIDLLENIIETDEKENQQVSTPSETNRPNRSLTNKIGENNFSFTLKRSFLRQKRSSIGYT